MLQVVQNIRSGETSVRDLPVPFAPDGGVLVAASASLISSGTERHVVQLARKNLLQKARERPDQVRRVIEKLKLEGAIPVFHQVVAKLDEPMPLGYSSAGLVLECGKGVDEFKPGDLVAVASPHAEVVVAGRNLCALVPDGVDATRACYAAVGAIALQGVRLAKLALGESVLVIGLGLVGQLAVMMLKAQGCRVFGSDLDPERLGLALSLGADAVGAKPTREQLAAFSGGYGVDATVIAAATDSNGPIEFAADVTRSKGRIVLVGVAGLDVPRAPFFAKELEFTVSSSLGAGRFDRLYEERGIDYPIGYARWTAQRNMAHVLELIAQGKLPVEKLTSHRFPIERAEDAYELITGKTRALGVVLTYSGDVAPKRRVALEASAKPRSGHVALGLIGAGNFTRLVLLPALASADGYSLRGICTANGLNAVVSGTKYGFAFATTDVKEIFEDAETHAVIIATRHDSHASHVVSAVRAGKHVFVEKPLCISLDELELIRRAVEERAGSNFVCVGFNRRFSLAVEVLRREFAAKAPLSIAYHFSAGSMPRAAWPQDEDVGGGRIVGEACHAIDTCTAIARSLPVRVFAESTRGERGIGSDERVMITMRHANGSISTVWYDSAGGRGAPAERIEVMGGERTAVVEDFDDVRVWSGGKVEVHAAKKDKGHRSELRAFVQGCRRGVAPMEWDEVYAVTRASLLAVQSLRTGLAMSVEASL